MPILSLLVLVPIVGGLALLLIPNSDGRGNGLVRWGALAVSLVVFALTLLLWARYDPAADKWTVFDLPTRGSEVRYISLDERNGTTQVVLPYFRTRKVAVMTLRSEADLAALKAQAGR